MRDVSSSDHCFGSEQSRKEGPVDHRPDAALQSIREDLHETEESNQTRMLKAEDQLDPSED